MNKINDKLSGKDIEVNTAKGAYTAIDYHLNSDEKRLKHSYGVPLKNLRLVESFDETFQELFLMSGLLHDIGYGEDIAITKFHPVDGYMYLRENGWNESICKVALMHTYSKEYMQMFRPDLQQFYQGISLTEDEQMLVDLITFADLHTTPRGKKCTLEYRISEIMTRSGIKSNAYLHMKSIENKVTKLDKWVRENFQIFEVI